MTSWKRERSAIWWVLGGWLRFIVEGSKQPGLNVPADGWEVGLYSLQNTFDTNYSMILGLTCLSTSRGDQVCVYWCPGTGMEFSDLDMLFG